ncbi:MAG TPA: hypothetical protein VHL52_07425 [Acidimicrobiia bacterium]|nr:hypothetical protein [Acidimicrobiia bacterium]
MTTHEHDVAQRRRVSVARDNFTFGQAVAGILGLLLAIVGGVAMARVGFDSLTGETAEVLGIGHTLALGIIDLVVGLLFLSAASTMFGVRGTLITLGGLALAFGAVVAIEPDPFVEFLGDGTPLGLAYLIVGVIALVAGMATPTYVSTESTYRDEIYDEDRAHH